MSGENAGTQIDQYSAGSSNGLEYFTRTFLFTQRYSHAARIKISPSISICVFPEIMIVISSNSGN
jgi:hypothetical protein